MPVQRVQPPHAEFRGVAGHDRARHGSDRRARASLPSGVETRIARSRPPTATCRGRRDEAITLDRSPTSRREPRRRVCARRRAGASPTSSRPPSCWMHESPMLRGRTYWLKQAPSPRMRRSRAALKIDVETSSTSPPTRWR
jgi:sulfate adenylyltransferase subunit 1 (EFTu-like GTPase family)